VRSGVELAGDEQRQHESDERSGCVPEGLHRWRL
jgi:hypothetical protein